MEDKDLQTELEELSSVFNESHMAAFQLHEQQEKLRGLQNSIQKVKAEIAQTKEKIDWMNDHVQAKVERNEALKKAINNAYKLQSCLNFYKNEIFPELVWMKNKKIEDDAEKQEKLMEQLHLKHESNEEFISRLPSQIKIKTLQRDIVEQQIEILILQDRVAQEKYKERKYVEIQKMRRNNMIVKLAKAYVEGKEIAKKKARVQSLRKDIETLKKQRLQPKDLPEPSKSISKKPSSFELFREFHQKRSFASSSVYPTIRKVFPSFGMNLSSTLGMIRGKPLKRQSTIEPAMPPFEKILKRHDAVKTNETPTVEKLQAPLQSQTINQSSSVKIVSDETIRKPLINTLKLSNQMKAGKLETTSSKRSACMSENTVSSPKAGSTNTSQNTGSVVISQKTESIAISQKSDKVFSQTSDEVKTITTTTVCKSYQELSLSQLKLKQDNYVSQPMVSENATRHIEHTEAEHTKFLSTSDIDTNMLSTSPMKASSKLAEYNKDEPVEHMDQDKQMAVGSSFLLTLKTDTVLIGKAVPSNFAQYRDLPEETSQATTKMSSGKSNVGDYLSADSLTNQSNFYSAQSEFEGGDNKYVFAYPMSSSGPSSDVEPLSPIQCGDDKEKESDFTAEFGMFQTNNTEEQKKTMFSFGMPSRKTGSFFNTFSFKKN